MKLGINEIITIALAVLSVVFVTYMLIKKLDARITLFTGGLFLLIAAAIMGKLIVKGGTGVAILDPFYILGNTFVTYISGAGIIIMLLFGYSSYMSKIGANDVTVMCLTKPLMNMKSPYVLAVFVFLIGNLLSIVVPSASSLAIILMATLYPVLKKANMSSLTAAAIIATSATIMPTPLGSDNVAIAKELQIDVMTYTYGKHALISIPGIIVMALAHYFWQKYMDRKSGVASSVEVEVDKLQGIRKDLPPTIYALLPLLPIILLIAAFVVRDVLNLKIDLSVQVVTLISFVVTIICEIIRRRSAKSATDDVKEFFSGMGAGFTQVVTLVVGATVFIEGLKAIGIISMLTDMAKGVQGAGLIIMFVFVFFILLIGLLSGSGNSALYAMIALVPPLTKAVNVPPHMVTIPMQMASNLVRTLTPLSAVIVIVASMIKENPLTLVKRTSVPALVTMVFTMTLSIILFFVLGF